MKILAGSTNVSVYYYIVQDASATSPGEPVTGLLFSDIETGGSASYVRQGAALTDLTLVTLASAGAAHADGGFILVSDSAMPGVYRCDYPDAAFATGVDQTILSIVVASAKNAVAAPISVVIDDSVVQTADHAAGIADIPTVSEFNARTLVAADYFDPTADAVATVTTLTNLPAITTNWLTATGIAASALDGKGNWNIGKTSYTLSQTFPANFSDFAITVTTGKVTAENVTLAAATHTGAVIPTVSTLAGHTAQTADHTANIAAILVDTGTTLPATIATIDGIVDTILIDTADLQANQGAWATATGFATSGALATVDGIVDNILLDTAEIGTAGAGLTDLGGMSTTMKTQVNTEALDVLATDTYAEPGQENPAANTTLADKINYLYKAWRNKSEQTSTTYSLYDDAGSTVDQKVTVSDNGTTAAKGEVGTGP